MIHYIIMLCRVVISILYLIYHTYVCIFFLIVYTVYFQEATSFTTQTNRSPHTSCQYRLLNFAFDMMCYTKERCMTKIT